MRNRRTKDDMTTLREAIKTIIEADPPMTVRQVFYQLVTRDLIEKTEQQYTNTVIRLMTEMRMSGELPFESVIDGSRSILLNQTFDNVQDAVNQTAKFYRRSALQQSNDYLEIWLEKAALSGVVERVTDEYDVPLMPSRGFGSLTFLYGTAVKVREAARHGKRSYIYQFGDHDPSGALIPQSITKRLTEICEMLDCEPPTVSRVALTPGQINRYRLPTRPTKREGNTHAKGFAGDSVELDASSSRVLRGMVRKVIEKHISPQATVALRVAEESEREQLKMWRPSKKRS